MYPGRMEVTTSCKIYPLPIVQKSASTVARWIVGQDVFSRQDYLLHTDYPAFIAKIRHDYRGKNWPFAPPLAQRLHDFVWLDPAPDEVAFLNLMGEADDALEQLDS